MKQLAILVPDEQTTMSTVACIVGAYQVFTEANACRTRQGKPALFTIALVGAKKNAVLQQAFLSIQATASAEELAHTDLVIIPATLVRSYDKATTNNQLLIDWLKKQYKQGAELASMCAGGFMLASTGILQGKTCSTHWALSEQFRELHPGVQLQTDKLITDECGIYTNGGAYSFLHLLLYLVEKFYDRPTAIHCAKYFQVDLNRHQQAEFAIFNGHKNHQDEMVLQAQQFIETNFPEKISVEKLAQDLAVGRRNFDRRFTKATSLSPLDYLQRVRTEAAKKLFETTRKTVAEVMYEVGYSDAKAFREVFSRVTGLSPIAYKSKYNKEGSVAMASFQ